jgi:hypothetical protein
MVQDDILKPIYDEIETQRTKGSSISRYGCADVEGKVVGKSDYVCFAAVRREPYIKDNAYYFWLVWNGEAFGGNTSTKSHWDDRDTPEKRQPGFEPGPRSDGWLEFLLSPEFSPWKAILPHLVTTDPVIIRKSGMIFKDYQKIDFGLFFNFIIATRYAYEFNHRVEFWEDLVKNYGIDPRAAYLISIGYRKGGNKKPEPRKVLKVKEGYRKNPGGFRYIKDEFGDKKWFPAEYDLVDDHPNWKPGDWGGELHATVGDGHCPLSTNKGYSTRILKSDPKLTGKTLKSAQNEYGLQAWDIFLDNREKRPEKSTLASVLECFEELKKDK